MSGFEANINLPDSVDVLMSWFEVKKIWQIWESRKSEPECQHVECEHVVISVIILCGTLLNSSSNGCGETNMPPNVSPNHICNRQTAPISYETERAQHSFCIFEIQRISIFSSGWILSRHDEVWSSLPNLTSVQAFPPSPLLSSPISAARRDVGPCCLYHSHPSTADHRIRDG